MYDSSSTYGINPQGNPPPPIVATPSTPAQVVLAAASDATAVKHWGIFGQVNVCATMASVRDGSSNTFAVGELQRFTSTTSASNLSIVDISHDGWAVGGDATLFSTGAVNPNAVGAGLMNNGYFASPGSEHAGAPSLAWAMHRFASWRTPWTLAYLPPKGA